MDSLLHEGIKLTIIGTIFVFISLFFLYLMIKVLRVLLNKSKTKDFTKNDLDISLVLSASAAYFLGQSNEEIYIPKGSRDESNWKLESRINPNITGE